MPTFNETESWEAPEVETNRESLFAKLGGIIDEFNTGIQPVRTEHTRQIKLAFFSPLDNYFWYGIRGGVDYARRQLEPLHAVVTHYTYENNAAEVRFPQDVKRCIEEGYDAILYPGFMHGADEQLIEAVKKGILIFTYNCDCDANIERVSCYAPNQTEAGEIAAQELAKAIDGEGDIAIVVGERVVALNVERYDSFVKVITEDYPDIHILETIDVVNDPKRTYASICDCLRRNPSITAIFSTTGMQKQLVKAIVDCGRKGSVQAVVFDKNQDICDSIRDGVIAASIDHDSFTQGYYPVVLMYNHLVDGTVLDPKGINCKVSVIDAYHLN